MNTEVVLETEKLKKHFGAVRAVEDVSLRVKRGEIFGFLGPNGSGKTTTISMILGLTHPNAGSVAVFGQRVTPANNSILRRVGTMVGAPSLLQPFSARQNLQCMACLRPDLPAKRIDEVLELVGLKGAAQRRVSKYSMGMRQRLGLALALVNRPDLFIELTDRELDVLRLIADGLSNAAIAEKLVISEKMVKGVCQQYTEQTTYAGSHASSHLCLATGPDASGGIYLRVVMACVIRMSSTPVTPPRRWGVRL